MDNYGNNNIKSFRPTDFPGCSYWFDGSDISTMFSSDYTGDISIPSGFSPLNVSGCSTWYDSSDISTLYTSSAGPVTPVSSPTQISGCALWLDISDSSTLYTTDAGDVSAISSPTGIPSCHLWLDSSDTSTITKDNNNFVSQWNDKSGKNNHATSTGAGRPLYTFNELNNYGAINFSGLNYMTVADSKNSLSFTTQPIGATFFLVVKPSLISDPNAYSMLLNNGNGSSINGFSIFFDDRVSNGLNNALRGGVFASVPGSSVLDYLGNNFFNNPTQYSLLSLIYDNNNANKELKTLIFNSGLMTSTRTYSSSVISASSGLPYTDLYIGSAAPDACASNFAEIIIYSGILSSANRSKVEKYLSNKWNLPIIHGLAGSGNSVGYITDKSNNNNNAIQYFSEKRPGISGSLNNLNTLKFNGISSYLNTTLLDRPNQTSFIVGKASANGGSIFGYTVNRNLTAYSSDRWRWYNPTVSGQVSPTNFGIVKTNLINDTTIEVFDNGIFGNSGGPPALPYNYYGDPAPLRIGAGYVGYDPYTDPGKIYNFSDLQLCELISFSGVLSYLESARIEKYLANKWGLSGIHSIVNSGDLVGYWGDKSINNKPAIQTSGDARPTYSGSTLYFDGINDVLKIGNLSSLYNTNSYGELFIVFEPVAGTTNYELYQTKVNYPIARSGAFTYFGSFLNNRTPGFQLGMPNSGLHMLGLRKSYNDPLFARFDGNYYFWDGTGGSFDAGNDHMIGASNQGPPNSWVYMKGKICEIISYNENIGNTNRALIEQYLAKKWGLENNLHKSVKYTNDKIGLIKNKGNISNEISSLGSSYNSSFLYQFNNQKKPLLGNINNKQGIDFTKAPAGDSFLQSLYNTNTNKEFSFFYVYLLNSLSGGPTTFTYGVQDNLALISRYNGNNITYAGSNTIGYSTPLPTGIPIVESVIKKPGGTNNTSYTSLFRNGISCTVGNSVGLASDMTRADGWLVLNGYNSPYTGAGDNKMILGEFIGFNRAVSDDERKIIEKYLYDKWNIGYQKLYISSPIQISGCSLWLDANDTNTLYANATKTIPITSNGQGVGYWADKAIGQDVSNTVSSGAFPTFVTNSQNGKPGLYFDGSNDNLLSSVNRITTGPCTLFVVCRPLTQTAPDIGGIMSYGDSTGGQGGPGIVASTNNQAISLDVAGGVHYLAFNTRGFTKIATAIYTGSTINGAYGFINGVGVAPSTSNFALTSNTNRIQIGGRTGGGFSTRIFNGYIYECLTYDRILNENERVAVENYLSNKWGVGSYSVNGQTGNNITNYKIKVSHPEAQSWVDRAFANGGTVSQRTANFVNDFCRKIDEAGLRDRFYRLNLFCGNDFNSCLVPLYLNTNPSGLFYGSRVDTYVNFSPADYMEPTGLYSSDVNNGKVLFTNLSPNDVNINISGHQSIYQTQFNQQGLLNTSRDIMGCGVVPGRPNKYFISVTTKHASYGYYLGAEFTVFQPRGGLIVSNRSDSNNIQGYENGILVGSGVVPISADYTAQNANFAVMGSTSYGNTVYNAAAGAVKSYSIGKSLSPSQVTSFNSIMEDFQTKLGRGVPKTVANISFSYVTNIDAQNWINSVYANGGTVSSGTAVAVNTFCNSIDSAGLRDRFIRLNLFCGDNLNAALVPLYRGRGLSYTTYGNRFDISETYGTSGPSLTNIRNFDDSDYIERGYSGGLQGNDRESPATPLAASINGRGLRTGIDLSLVPDIIDQNKYSTGNNVSRYFSGFHLSFYSKSLDNTYSQHCPIGVYSAPAGGVSVGGHGFSILFYPSNDSLVVGPFSANLSIPNYGRQDKKLYLADVAVTNTFVGGHYASDINFYAGSGLYASGVVSAGPWVSANHDVAIFAEGRPSPSTQSSRSSQRLQGYSIGLKMTSNQVSQFYTIMETFQAALSRNMRPSDNPIYSGVNNPDAKRWVDNVINNSGTVSVSTANAINTLCSQIEASGLRSKIYRLNMFCGDNLNAATLPIYTGPAYSGTQYGYGIEFVSNLWNNNDYTSSGIFGGLKGSGTKYIDTGVTQNTFTNSDRHLSVHERTRTIGQYMCLIGSDMASYPITSNINTWTLQYNSNNTTIGYYGGTNNQYIYEKYTSPIGAHIFGNGGTSSAEIYRNGILSDSTNVFSSITPGALTLCVFASNFANNTQAFHHNGVISYYSVGKKFTSSEVKSYYDILKNFETSIGRIEPREFPQFSGVNNLDAQIWLDNLYYNGGSASSETALAVNTFANSITNSGIRNKFYRLNLMTGDNFNSSLIPLYVGPSPTGNMYGRKFDQNFYFIPSDYTASGNLQEMFTGFSTPVISNNLSIGIYYPSTQTINCFTLGGYGYPRFQFPVSGIAGNWCRVSGLLSGDYNYITQIRLGTVGTVGVVTSSMVGTSGNFFADVFANEDVIEFAMDSSTANVGGSTVSLSVKIENLSVKKYTGGLKGNGTNKFLNTDLYTLHLPNATNRHISIYENTKSYTTYDSSIGAGPAGGGAPNGGIMSLQTAAALNQYGVTNNAIDAYVNNYTFGKTHWIGQNTTLRQYNLYKDGYRVVDAISPVDSYNNNNSFTILAWNNSGVPSSHSQAAINAYSIGTDFNDAEAASYTDSMEKFQTSLNRGRSSSVFNGITNKDAKDWIDRVYSNGGTISQNTATAVNTFCNNIDSYNLRNKFYRLNLFCGNNLAACLTPLYLGPSSSSIFYGFIYDRNFFFAESDYIETGSNYGLRSSGADPSVINVGKQYLDTGLSIKDFATPGLVVSDMHMSSTMSTIPITANITPIFWNTYNYTDNYVLGMQILAGGYANIRTSIGGQGVNGRLVPDYTTGQLVPMTMIIGSRITDSDIRVYHGSNQLGINTNTVTAALNAQIPSLLLFRQTSGFYGNMRMGHYSVGLGLDSTQVTNFNIAMSGFNSLLNRT